MKNGKIILISGAARSGKSTFAEELAGQYSEQVAYLATAQALDQEMEERIKNHVARRLSTWQTFEEPLNIKSILKENCLNYQTWLLDCLTLYVCNLLFALEPQVKGDNLLVEELDKRIMKEIEDLILTIEETDITMIIVTNEVGWGLVPPDPLSRAYRDLVGRANQKLARQAHAVYLVALGLPLKLK